MLSRRGPLKSSGGRGTACVGGRMIMDRKPPVESGGSHRITWERCPRCGRRAAVGWRPAAATHLSRSVPEHAVEFDCVSGCSLSVDELVRSFPPLATARPRSLRHSEGSGGPG